MTSIPFDEDKPIFSPEFPSLESDAKTVASDQSSQILDEVQLPSPIKLLVHNISHADIVICLQPTSVSNDQPEMQIVARPVYSTYKVRSTILSPSIYF